MTASDLSGAWTGVYDYADPRATKIFQATPFNAEIEDSAGALSGRIVEPALDSGAGRGERRATISGSRQGNTVRFVKTYDTMNGQAWSYYQIRYRGVCNADMTRIDGEWRILGVWSGPFVMNRATGKSESADDEARSDEGRKTPAEILMEGCFGLYPAGSTAGKAPRETERRNHRAIR